MSPWNIYIRKNIDITFVEQMEQSCSHYEGLVVIREQWKLFVFYHL